MYQRKSKLYNQPNESPQQGNKYKQSLTPIKRK